MILPYIMALFTSLVSIYFILLYGLKFNTDLEETWFTNIAASLAQEFLFMEFAIAFGLSFLNVMIMPRLSRKLTNWATKPVMQKLEHKKIVTRETAMLMNERMVRRRTGSQAESGRQLGKPKTKAGRQKLKLVNQPRGKV
uniref:Uncharacterized protein n=2 Tax=Palpitomonas bilix TaxID=652834 RepID=A0A7S3D4D8_9EUKA|mmetsp:Transcript_21249/g.55277  ORF Transcript_21249/g.55277 Transcript_21249/m.55277 type:complete len:140 (+) Transcript_21249:559-978(+)